MASKHVASVFNDTLLTGDERLLMLVIADSVGDGIAELSPDMMQALQRKSNMNHHHMMYILDCLEESQYIERRDNMICIQEV
jgi:DNA-binding MarR family transcriptional regulator